MDKWLVLGIEKTKDKDEIKKAYRRRLIKVNPEDDSEGFMQLREAYEEAIKEADVICEEPQESQSEIEIQLNDVYMDFSRRIDIEEWKALFLQDEFVALDSVEDSLDILLSFIMQHNFLPQYVFKLIVDNFDIYEKKSYLIERYPINFIEYIISNSKYRDTVDYRLFDEISKQMDSERLDSFIDMCYNLQLAMRNRNFDEQRRIIEMLDETGINHPYLSRTKLIHSLQLLKDSVEDNEQLMEQKGKEVEELSIEAFSLMEDYPEDIDILNTCGHFSYLKKQYETAKELFEKAMEILPEDYTSKENYADALLMLGENEKARDIYMELLDINPHDFGAVESMNRANEAIAAELEEKLKNVSDEGATETVKMKLELAWCYYRNKRYEEAIALLESFEPGVGNLYEYNDLLGRDYLYIKNYEKALMHFERCESIIEAFTEEELAEFNKIKKAKYRFFIGICYMEQKDFETARVYFEKSINEEIDAKLYSLEAICRCLYDAGYYEECIRRCEELILMDDENYEALLYRAKALYELEEYGEAMAACDRAISVYRYYSDPYVVKIKIYWQFEQYDDMQAVVDSYKQLGCISDSIEYYNSRLLQWDGKTKEARKTLGEIIDRREKTETDLESYINVYLQMANCCYIERDYDMSCKYYDELLLLAPDDNKALIKRIYAGKAAAFACGYDFISARSCFEEYLNSHEIDIAMVIDYAELLVRMDDYESCEKYLRQCIEMYPDTDIMQQCIGNLCCFAGNEGHMDTAWEMFKLALAYDSEDFKIYRSMGSILLEHGKVSEARKMYEKAFMLDTERESYICGMYLVAISKLDDVNKPEYQQIIDVAYEQLENVDDPYAYIKKAEFYRGMGDYEKALEMTDFAESCERYPLSIFDEDNNVWYERGYIYEAMKDYEKALMCYKKALQIFGHNELYRLCINRIEEMQ